MKVFEVIEALESLKAEMLVLSDTTEPTIPSRLDSVRSFFKSSNQPPTKTPAQFNELIDKLLEPLKIYPNQDAYLGALSIEGVIEALDPFVADLSSFERICQAIISLQQLLSEYRKILPVLRKLEGRKPEIIENFLEKKASEEQVVASGNYLLQFD